MKYLLIIIISFLSFQSIKAQSDTIENELTNIVLNMDSYLTDSDQAVELANKFEQIANAKKDNWLPYYYASYCYVMAAFMQNDVSKIDPITEKSESLLNHAAMLSTNNSEISCIRSLIASARIMVNPNLRGMKYGIISGQMLDQAKLENSNNPRVYLLEAQSLMFMPKEYGGGCENARPLLIIAIDKYRDFKMESNIHPSWGFENVLKLFCECNIQISQ